ncbi:Aflatoxin B1 aldehyde reductase member 2 [Madurella fahalii]|uniref:Aflatoxin B1 aldehyde reductase member 2 n=1 Tax=Madurella fahalii TaxID=1157608 RepID=A0ABQ0GGT8_9PEZI
MTKPRIILGLMTFAPDENNGGRITNLDDFKKCLDIFQAHGFSEVDTARAYGIGQQEAFTRQAGWKERGLQLATKVFPLPPGAHKPEEITKTLETSLNELGTDSVDIFYLHAPDRSIPFLPTLKHLDALHRAGKFRRLGLSNYTAYEVAEIACLCAQHNLVRPTVYQGIYNCMQRNIEAELIPCCRRYGLDVVIYAPIMGGLLTGAFENKDVVPTEGRFSNKFFNGLLRERYFKDGYFDAVRELKETADKYGVSMIEVGLRWIANHSMLRLEESEAGKGDGILIGVSKVEHLEQNLGYLAKGPLPDELLAAVDRMWKVAMPDAAPYWYGELEYGYDTLQEIFGKGP